MSTLLNPYIHFQDDARQAMEFYQTVFGGTLHMNTFKEAQFSRDPADDNKIMHAQLETPNGLILMGADTPSGMEPGSMAYRDLSRITISLSGDNEPELKGYYEKLVAGGTVEEPLEKAPWGDTFGMLVDKFGVHWMVNISGQPG